MSLSLKGDGEEKLDTFALREDSKQEKTYDRPVHLITTPSFKALPFHTDDSALSLCSRSHAVQQELVLVIKEVEALAQRNLVHIYQLLICSIYLFFFMYLGHCANSSAHTAPWLQRAEAAWHPGTIPSPEIKE